MDSRRTDVDPIEAVIVVLVCFGFFIVVAVEAAARRLPIRLDDVGFVWLVFYEIIAAVAALTFLQARRYPIASLFPTPTIGGIGIGALLYVISGAVAAALLLPFGAAAAEDPLRLALAEATVSTAIVVMLGLVNGTFEEVFLLGFLQRGLKRHGAVIAIGVSSLIRVLYHVYQGPYGALSVFGFGMVLSLYYLRTERLFPVVLAHVVADIVPFADVI